MALNFAPSSSLSTASLRFQIGKGIATKNHSSVLIKPATSEKYIYHCKAAAQSEGVAEEESNSTGSSARTQLDLLEQLTSSTSSTSGKHNNSKNYITLFLSLSSLDFPKFFERLRE
ncbi:uncharacterized protein A4U43_C05F28870 [Asparagus officinalis]|uniref:Uncharacterized protein n=1 Tax=Asparagus officinalis TaxID=4686 RepID=A0A5P1EVN7_ASPOF|nr:uncharacterized protein A4U43_C05F28870 [Asparagus officinalis]